MGWTFYTNLGQRINSVNHNVPANLTAIKTANYTAIVGDDIIQCNSTAGGFAITLPSGVANGQVFAIKDIAGVAGTPSKRITVDTAGAELIDGQVDYLIQNNYGGLTVYYNGTNWSII
jgi:hypothetical protein